jgi:hypothetical protein
MLNWTAHDAASLLVGRSVVGQMFPIVKQGDCFEQNLQPRGGGRCVQLIPIGPTTVFAMIGERFRGLAYGELTLNECTYRVP